MVVALSVFFTVFVVSSAGLSEPRQPPETLCAF